MKHVYLASLTVATLLSSCMALNTNKKTQTSAAEPSATPASTEVTVTPPATAPSSAPKINATAPAPAKTHNVRHRSRLYGRLSGEWTIVKAGKTSVPFEEEMPYLIFNEKQWEFYASNGCNILNGTFVYTGEKNIRFESVLSTMKYCPDVPYEAEINTVLSDDNTVTAKIEQSGRETYLNLLNADGQTVLRLRRHNLDFLNGQWNVRKIGNSDVSDAGVSIFFDVPELKVHGNSGCNYFNGALEIDPYRTSSISFKNMAVTMRACPNLDIETKFLVALEQVSQVKNSGSNQVYLVDRQGHTVLTLIKAEDK